MIRNFEKETRDFMGDSTRRRLADYYNNEPVDRARLAAKFRMSEKTLADYMSGGTLDCQTLFGISEFLRQRKY